MPIKSDRKSRNDKKIIGLENKQANSNKNSNYKS